MAIPGQFRPMTPRPPRRRSAPSRRDLLRTVGLLGAGSLAGCTDLLGGDDDAPWDWLYAPSEFGDWTQYLVRYAEPSPAFDHEGTLTESSVERFREHLFVGSQNDLGLDPADVDWFLGAGDALLHVPAFAATGGPLDAPALRSKVEALRSPSFRRADEYRGFDLYEGGSEVAGVGEGRLLWATAANSLAPLEVAIDASDGRVARLQERKDSAATLVDHLFPATYAFLKVRDDDGWPAEGFAQTIEGERTAITNVLVYESTDDVPDAMTDAEFFTDDTNQRVEDVAHRVEDRVVVTEGWIPTAEVELGLWPFRFAD